MAKIFRKPHRIKRRKSIFKNRFFWLTILFLIITGTIVYFLIFSSFFQIKEIEISGNQKVSTENLKEKIYPQITKNFWKFSSRSIFLVNLSKIKKDFLENFPQIANLSLKRKFPNSLIFEIEERKPSAIWCHFEKCFFVDKGGIIFEEIFEVFPNLKIKDDREGEIPQLGEKAIEEKIFNSILEIEKELRENLKIDIEELILISEERLNVKTSENWEIYFNLKGDIDWQIAKLNLVLEKEIPPEKRKDLEYIDLRFERVYYKFR